VLDNDSMERNMMGIREYTGDNMDI
jgi:hypothetical protein